MFKSEDLITYLPILLNKLYYDSSLLHLLDMEKSDIIESTFDILKGHVSMEKIVISSCALGGLYLGIQLSNGDFGLSIYNNEIQPEIYEKASVELIGESVNNTLEKLSSDPSTSDYCFRIAILSAISQTFLTNSYLNKIGICVEELDYTRIKVKDFDKFVAGKEKIAVVGLGGPIELLFEIVNRENLYVVELLTKDYFSTRLIDSNGVSEGPLEYNIISPDEFNRLAGTFDLIIITGSTLSNGTLDSIVKNHPNSELMLYGPSASIYPEILFSRGIEYIFTEHFIQPDNCLSSLINFPFYEDDVIRRQKFSKQILLKKL